MGRDRNNSSDLILIEDLELSARVGVPDEERAKPQRLTVSITMELRVAFGGLGDDLEKTVDYSEVCLALHRFASGRSDRLIETLASGMANHLLDHFPVALVRLELRKFVLPNTRFVAVRVTRRRP
ncbi:MAG: dihydroneopterin aldolase [Chthoniobacterales bacterium]